MPINAPVTARLVDKSDYLNELADSRGRSDHWLLRMARSAGDAASH